MKKHKILARDTLKNVGVLQTPSGEFITDEDQVLRCLINTHFPGATEQPMEELHNGRSSIEYPLYASWTLAKEIVNLEGLRWAIGSFKDFKTPGHDQTVPALLKQGLDIISKP